MPGRKFYAWSVAACTVRVALDVIDRLNVCLSDPRLRPNEEQGGILYGTVREGVPEITNFEFFRSEHRRGVAYDLGARERAEVSRLVRARLRHGSEKPLGYFRTHLRPGLFLDQGDFAVMEESFARPEAVSLLIRSDGNGQRTAGFFFWEDGDIDRRQTHRSFPFNTAALPPEAIVMTEPVRVRRAVWPFPAPSLKWAAAAALVVPALAAMVVFHRSPRLPHPVQPTLATVIVAPPPRLRQPEPPPEPTAPPAPDLPKDEGAKRPARRPALSERARESDTEPRVKPEPVAPAPPPEAAAPPPPVAAPAPVREEPRREKSVIVAVTMEPRMIKSGKASELRKAVGRVPLLGHAFRPKEETFTPAKPERTLAPRVTGRLAEELLHEFPVDVRVSISSAGAVTTAEVLNGAGTSYANLAAQTASSTAWQPALVGDRQVASEMILHYVFHPAE